MTEPTPDLMAALRASLDRARPEHTEADRCEFRFDHPLLPTGWHTDCRCTGLRHHPNVSHVCSHYDRHPNAEEDPHAPY